MTLPVDDLTDVIDELGGTYQARRGDAPTVDANGFAVPGAPSPTFDIIASVQPLSGEELENLREGERSQDFREVYTSTELRPTKPEDGTLGDHVVLDGVEYEVQKCQDWKGVAGFFHVVVARVGR